MKYHNSNSQPNSFSSEFEGAIDLLEKFEKLSIPGKKVAKVHSKKVKSIK